MEAARPLPFPLESDRRVEYSPSDLSAHSISLVTTPVPPADPHSERLSGLLVATAQRDCAAFSRLYALTSGKLFAVALRVVGRRDVAEDILQDAYLTIWRRAGQHRPGSGSALGWMLSVVRHRAIDWMRRNRRVDAQCGEHRGGSVAAQEPACDETLEIGRMNESLRECLAGLPANHRNAVIAAFYQGLSHQELALRFDVPVGTVKSWVRRGLLELRACLESRSKC